MTTTIAGTSTSTVPAPVAPPGGTPRRLGRYWIALAISLGLFASAWTAASLLDVPYYAFAPGAAYDTTQLVEVGGGRPTYPSDGHLFFLTVRLRNPSLLESVFDWADRDIDIVPEQGVLQGRTPEENRAAQAAAMSGSEATAIVVALDRLGIPRTPSGTGAVITSVGDDTPAFDAVGVADVIVAVDGEPVLSSADLGVAIGAHAPGDEVTLSIQGYDGTDRDATVTLAAREDDSTKGFLGVGSETRDFDPGSPFPIAIPNQGVGGPSAGLAFTLSILDVLTEGQLTGGHSIAITGTIAPDGTVGVVGGVAQKSAAAAAAGATAMIVPLGEEAEAMSLGYDLQVIGVSNLQEALDALESLGGDPLPAPASAPT